MGLHRNGEAVTFSLKGYRLLPKNIINLRRASLAYPPRDRVILQPGREGKNMDKLIPLGRLFFAIGLAGFGILQFIYGDFVAGRAPAWPDDVPGRLVWAYSSGVLLIAAGVAIALGKKGRLLVLLTGVMIFLWALLRNLPLAADQLFGSDWTRTGKSLAFFAGAFAMAGAFPRERTGGFLGPLFNSTAGFLNLGRVCLSLFMILCGIQHFLFEEFVSSLVPVWIPGPYFWTYFAGVALIAGGVGLLIPATTRWAATLSGLMIFLWVIMLHIPRALGGIDPRGEWTSVFEALALSGLAFMLSRLLPVPKREHSVVGQAA